MKFVVIFTVVISLVLLGAINLIAENSHLNSHDTDILGAIWLVGTIVAFITSIVIVIQDKNEDSKKINEQEQWDIARNRDHQRWNDEFQRKIIEEETLARIRNISQIEMYREQVNLMLYYKQAGASIDKDILDMRKKLLKMERKENDRMVQDLLKTLDGI